jgi:hypothetical protein
LDGIFKGGVIPGAFGKEEENDENDSSVAVVDVVDVVDFIVFVDDGVGDIDVVEFLSGDEIVDVDIVVDVSNCVLFVDSGSFDCIFGSGNLAGIICSGGLD